MRLDDRFRWLIWLSFAEIGTMLVFNNYSALLPILQKEWSLTNSEAGWIFSSYQIGYILADALARFGFVPNWGWAFMILGLGGLMGPLILWPLKKKRK
jgi:fucose permease